MKLHFFTTLIFFHVDLHDKSETVKTSRNQIMIRYIRMYLNWLDDNPIWLISDGNKTEVSTIFPSFNQVTVGFGFPRGGRHFKTAVSPSATLVSTGMMRKSSLSTEIERNIHLKTLLESSIK